MKRNLFGFAVWFILFLVACGGGPAGGPATESSPPSNESQLGDELRVYNWTDYIDPQILEDYTAQYGVNIVYDTYASNEDLLAKLQAGATGYDVIFPSDYMVVQLLELGLLAEISPDQMPNFANLDPAFQNPPFDPGNQHCIPYQWGTTGIAYRAGYELFEQTPPDSWAFIFDPELLQQYSGDGVNVLNDQRELIGAALAYLGYSINETDEAKLNEARDLILQAKPYWKTFNSEDYQDSLLVPDEVVISQSWSGDALQAYWDTYDEATADGNWRYVVAKEGGVRWVDNVCILVSSQRQATAEHFLNYLLEPTVSAAISNFTSYASPNRAAMEFIDPEILNNPAIYPPAGTLANLQWIEDIGDGVFLYDQIWTTIKSQ